MDYARARARHADGRARVKEKEQMIQHETPDPNERTWVVCVRTKEPINDEPVDKEAEKLADELCVRKDRFGLVVTDCSGNADRMTLAEASTLVVTLRTSFGVQAWYRFQPR